MTTANDIRSTFLSYYEQQGHKVVASSALVPDNDPTLMFTNAGMVQFKNIFTGQEQRDYNRAVTSQKCVRAGGKHNDLENVGHTARHHTFFEMLGNFSFGDYFKDLAIEYAWNLITKEYGLPKDKLLVTVYHTDDEAAQLWKKIAGLSDDKIIRIPTSDNFWAMGDTGPCGPCSEIFYDHGDKIWGGPPGSADEDGDRFIEIWNLVFMQFEKHLDGRQVSLPQPSIDTGMGLERISAVLQGKHDNYDIDLMRALIEASAHASNDDPDGPHNVSHRVIADHLRSSAFLIADGVLPSNEGRGYVLRRIMRRGMRHAHMIGNTEPMMHKLVPALVTEMGEHFGELRQAEALITETLRHEETRFKQTLDRGLKLLRDATSKLGDGQALPGETAFKLYDTFGFPLDLTQDILRGEQRPVDMDGFNAAMQAQKDAARAAWAGSGDTATESLWFEIEDEVGATEFLGYGNTKASGEVRALVKDGVRVQALQAGETGFAVLNQTPFYAESGGQQGDQGVMLAEDGTCAQVQDTQKKLGKLWVHAVQVDKGSLIVGQGLDLEVDTRRRSALAQHHSATHLLHEALRRALGDHVAQRGSLVAGDRLRFDFSHSKPVSAAELEAIEQTVNARVVENSTVSTRIMTPDEARALGAQALFGEKYGDEVRVVAMGAPDAGSDKPYSLELCGGTHVARTGDIGLVKLVTEEGLAAGIRRIEAVAGDAALGYFNQREAILGQAASLLKVAAGDVPGRIEALLAERKKLENQLADMRKQLATGGASGAETQQLGGMTFVGKLLDGVPGKELKAMADALKGQVGSGVVALVSNSDGKGSVVVGVTDDLTGKVSAVDLVKAAASAMGGQGGGGRADMAQAGGPNGADGQAALDAITAQLMKG